MRTKHRVPQSFSVATNRSSRQQGHWNMTDSKRLDRSPIRYRVVGPVSRGRVGKISARAPTLCYRPSPGQTTMEMQCLCSFDPTDIRTCALFCGLFAAKYIQYFAHVLDLERLQQARTARRDAAALFTASLKPQRPPFAPIACCRCTVSQLPGAEL
jgi:hypothetical protein